MNEATAEINLPTGEPVEMVALAVKKSAIRCRILSTGQPVTLRGVSMEVEGEILTVVPSKIWRYGRTNYMSGKVLSTRIDIPALHLQPLGLNRFELWNPEEDYWMEADEPVPPWLQKIFDYGPRPSCEMDQIIPFQDPQDMDSDPIFEAVDCHNAGNFDGAYKIIEKLLAADLRCIDAHAHLGNWEFNRTKRHNEFIIDKARRHYEIGLRIGELSLGDDFDGLLPWSMTDNRPYLRCLHGYGLSLWRLGRPGDARMVFERILWLNPNDNQGARFLLADNDEGLTWEELSE